MNPSESNTLKAFIAALSQLEQPLPTAIQTQLNEIGKALDKDPANIKKLRTLTNSYKPLNLLNDKGFAAILADAGERSKGLEPLPLENITTAEITNVAIDIFSATDSVASAKKFVKPNILQKFWKAIRGKN